MKTIIVSLLAIVATPAWAAKTVAVVPDNVAAVKSLDEIVVQGDRTLSAARRAIYEAEDRFYARWNDVNGDHRFDIKCHLETPPDYPSHIAHRVCQPQFVEDVRQDQAREFMQQVTGTISAQGNTLVVTTANPTLMFMTTQLRKRVLAMINTDSQLKRALLERARLEQHYQALRKDKFAHRWAVWD